MPAVPPMPIVLVAQPHALHKRRIVLDSALAHIGLFAIIADESLVSRLGRFARRQPAIDFDRGPLGHRIDSHAAVNRAHAHARPAAQADVRPRWSTSST